MGARVTEHPLMCQALFPEGDAKGNKGLQICGKFRCGIESEVKIGVRGWCGVDGGLWKLDTGSKWDTTSSVSRVANPVNEPVSHTVHDMIVCMSVQFRDGELYEYPTPDQNIDPSGHVFEAPCTRRTRGDTILISRWLTWLTVCHFWLCLTVAKSQDLTIQSVTRTCSVQFVMRGRASSALALHQPVSSK